MAHILLIEPNHQIAKTTGDFLVSHGHHVSRVRTADQAIEAADKQKPDIVITELSLRGHSGFEFLYELRTYHDWRAIPVIVYTTVQVTDAVQNSRSWHQLGIFAYLYKPTASLRTIVDTIERCYTVV